MHVKVRILNSHSLILGVHAVVDMQAFWQETLTRESLSLSFFFFFFCKFLGLRVLHLQGRNQKTQTRDLHSTKNYSMKLQFRSEQLEEVLNTNEHIGKAYSRADWLSQRLNLCRNLRQSGTETVFPCYLPLLAGFQINPGIGLNIFWNFQWTCSSYVSHSLSELLGTQMWIQQQLLSVQSMS